MLLVDDKERVRNIAKGGNGSVASAAQSAANSAHEATRISDKLRAQFEAQGIACRVVRQHLVIGDFLWVWRRGSMVRVLSNTVFSAF